MAYCKKITNQFPADPADFRRYQETFSVNLLNLLENEIPVWLGDIILKVFSQDRVDTTILNNSVFDNIPFQGGFKFESCFLKSFPRASVI